MDIKEIPIKQIVTKGLNPRGIFDSNHITELAASIKRDGQWDPVIVNQRPDGKYDLIAGECRLRAIKRIGCPKVKGRILHIKKDEAYLLALKTNLVRRNLNPIEESNGINKLIGSGWDRKKIARELGKSQAWISLRLKMTRDAGEGLQNAVVQEKISLTHAMKIAELPKSLQGPVIEKVVGDRLNLIETNRLVTLLKGVKSTRGLKAILEMPREKLSNTAPFIVTQQLGGERNCIASMKCKCGVVYIVDWGGKRMVDMEKFYGQRRKSAK